MDAAQASGYAIIAAGVALSLTALILYRKKAFRLEGFMSTTGVVSGLAQSGVNVFTSGSTDDNLAFREEENIFKGEACAPLIEFSDGKGRKHTIKGIASSPPKYKIGQRVAVLYPGEAPETAVVDSFLEKWFVISMVGGFGLIFLASGILVLFLVTA